MKVALLNVKYSPNLGDGIISECLEHTIGTIAPSIQVESCDIAGRTEYGSGLNASRLRIHQLLDRLPSFLKTLVSATLLRLLIQTRLKSHYQRHLEGCDAALIGGGQLIADNLLNFPLKLASACRIARKNNLSIAVFGVGVASSFSRKGMSLFRKAFGDALLFARVRDQDSVTRWDRNFKTPPADLVNDPGLLTSAVYPAPNRPKRQKPLIGIGITHPSTLKLHSDQKTDIQSLSDWIAFYIDLVQTLSAKGIEIELFTNGAGDDVLFAKLIADALQNQSAADERVAVVDNMAHPSDLAMCIAKYDGIIAHRLHANIVAFSYAIPHVGLAWDSKMHGFFARAERLPFLVENLHRAKTAEIAELALRSLSKGIKPERVNTLMQETKAHIKTLVRDLEQARSRTHLQLAKPTGKIA